MKFKIVANFYNTANYSNQISIIQSTHFELYKFSQPPLEVRNLLIQSNTEKIS